MNKYSELGKQYERMKNDEAFLLEKMSLPDERRYFISSVELTNIDLALYNLFIANDAISARSNFYTAGRISAYAHENYKDEIFLIRFFLYAILSDSSSLVARYLTFDKSKMNKSFAFHFCSAIQSIIKEDDTLLKESLVQLKKISKKDGRIYIPLRYVFSRVFRKRHVVN